MTDIVEDLMTANLLDVFNQRDPQRRRDAIDRIYTSDIAWTDDDGVTTGPDALNAKAQALLDGQLAGLSFTKAGPVHRLHGFGYLAWDVVAPGNDEPIVSGFDVALIDGDKISQLFTVLTKVPG